MQLRLTTSPGLATDDVKPLRAAPDSRLAELNWKEYESMMQVEVEVLKDVDVGVQSVQHLHEWVDSALGDLSRWSSEQATESDTQLRAAPGLPPGKADPEDSRIEEEGLGRRVVGSRR